MKKRRVNYQPSKQIRIIELNSDIRWRYTPRQMAAVERYCVQCETPNKEEEVGKDQRRKRSSG